MNLTQDLELWNLVANASLVVKAVMLLLALITDQELMQHSYHWRMAEVEESLRRGLIQPAMASARIINAVIVSGKDRVYEMTLILSGAVSLLSFTVAVVLSVSGYREQRVGRIDVN